MIHFSSVKNKDETLKGTYVDAEICTQDRFKKWLEEKVEQGFGDYVWKGGLVRRFLVDDVHIHGDVGDVVWNTVTVGEYDGYYLPLWAVIFIIRTAKTKPLTPKKALKFVEEPILTEADFGIQFGFNYVDDRVNWQLNPPFGTNNKGIEGAYLIPPINDYHSWHVVFP